MEMANKHFGQDIRLFWFLLMMFIIADDQAHKKTGTLMMYNNNLSICFFQNETAYT